MTLGQPSAQVAVALADMAQADDGREDFDNQSPHPARHALLVRPHVVQLQHEDRQDDGHRRHGHGHRQVDTCPAEREMKGPAA